MGVGIDQLEVKKRSEKLSFLEVQTSNGESEYYRMEAFTNLEFSQNTEESSVQFVDEDTKRTRVVGHSESVDYEFVHYIGQPALEELVKITEGEMVGKAAVRNIVTVDMTTANLSTGSDYTAKATIRPYSVVPSSNGGSTEHMSYSGTFKANGTKKNITVGCNKDNEWQKITIQTNSASVSALSEG